MFVPCERTCGTKDVGGDGCGVPHAPPRLRCISAALPRGRISLPPNAGETRGRKRRKIHLRGLRADLQSPSPGLYVTIENKDFPPPISAGSPQLRRISAVRTKSPQSRRPKLSNCSTVTQRSFGPIHDCPTMLYPSYLVSKAQRWRPMRLFETHHVA